MPKRFTSTEIWSEDWFLDMPTEYKLFWHYMLASCNHAGFFRVNLRSFCALNGVTVTPADAIKYFNFGKDRIRILSDGLWFIEDFFSFQYGPTFNPNNRVHESIEKECKKNGVNLTSIRGLKDLKDRVKDKDKDIDSSIEVGSKKTTRVEQPATSVERAEAKALKKEKEELFLKFYDAYGKKIGKADAEKAWLKIDIEIMPAIVAKAKIYAAVIPDKNFQPHPASWLNAKRWEDEYKPTASSRPSNPNSFI